MGRALVVVALLAGCIDDSVQHCGDVICPTAQICVDDVRCVSQDALCTGSAQAACTAAGVAGRCTDHGSLRVCDPAVCGDGVIDTALHEDCDGSASFTAQCADLGFDLGRPGCAADCTFDLGTCTKFGWDPVVNAAIYAFWTDGTTLAYAQHNPETTIVTGGGWNVSEPQFVGAIAGGGGHVYASAAAAPVEITKTGFLDLRAPFIDGAVTSIAVDTSGALYVTEECALWKYDGTWKNEYGSPSLCPHLVTIGGDGGVYFVGASNVVYEMIAGAPSARFGVSGVLEALHVVGANEIYAGGTQGLWAWLGTGSAVQIGFGDVRSIAMLDGLVYAGLADGSGLRWDGAQIDRFTPPTAALADDGHGHLYSYTGPLYRYSGMMFGDLSAITFGTQTERMTSIARFADASIVATSSFEMWSLVAAGGGWNKNAGLSPSYNHAIAGVDAIDLAAATDDNAGGGANPHVWRMIGGGPWNTYDPPGQPVVDGLWMDTDTTVRAAGFSGTDGFLGVQDKDGAWLEHETDAGCDFHGVDHDVAVGACGGVASIWRYDGTGWSELHREMTIAGALRGVKVLASGDIFAVGDAGAVWFTAGVWTADPTIHGRSIDGTSGDVWVAGEFTDVQHWDGTSWTRMTTRALGPEVIAVSPHRVLMPGGGVGHVVLLR